jgi:hypothetical protein
MDTATRWTIEFDLLFFLLLLVCVILVVFCFVVVELFLLFFVRAENLYWILLSVANAWRGGRRCGICRSAFMLSNIVREHTVILTRLSIIAAIVVSIARSRNGLCR